MRFRRSPCGFGGKQGADLWSDGALCFLFTRKQHDTVADALRAFLAGTFAIFVQNCQRFIVKSDVEGIGLRIFGFRASCAWTQIIHLTLRGP